MTQLSIDSLAAGGDGVGRDDTGRVTFVPRTAPGDSVRVEILDERKAFARGRLVEVLEPSDARVEPPCELFADERCGGCQWQHVSRGAQLAAKRDIVVSALRDVARPDQIADIESPSADYGWRRRARFHWFRRRGTKRAVVGLFSPGTHKVTEVAECPQLSPALGSVLGAIRSSLSTGLHKRGELEMVVGIAGDVHIHVAGPCTASAAKALMDSGAIAGVSWGRRSLGKLAVEVDPGVLASADQFVQASAAGNEALRRIVAGACSDVAGRRVLELFAGAGNFTRELSAAGAEVIAVDTRPGGADLERVVWQRGQAHKVADGLAHGAERFDLVLLDPPRAGAKDCMASVAKVSNRAVYVSCDPATLARDLSTLKAEGFEVERVWPADLMPQTAHVEAVALTTRKTS